MTENNKKYGKFGLNLEKIKEENRFRGQTNKTGMLTTPIMLGENVDYDDPTIDNTSEETIYDDDNNASESIVDSLGHSPVSLPKYSSDIVNNENFYSEIIPSIIHLYKKISYLDIENAYTINYFFLIVDQIILKCLGKSGVGNIIESKRIECINKVNERINILYNDVLLAVIKKVGNKIVPYDIFDFLNNMFNIGIRTKLRWKIPGKNVIYVKPSDIGNFTYEIFLQKLIEKSHELIEADRNKPQQTFKPLTTTDEPEGEHVEVGGKTRKLKRKSSKRKSSKRKSSK
jgi:hypothetical protein